MLIVFTLRQNSLAIPPTGLPEAIISITWYSRSERISWGRFSESRSISPARIWRWSTSFQPIAKTKSCEIPHFQYHVAGILKVVMDDGTETPYLASITMAVPCRNMRPKSTRSIEEFLKRSLEDHADLRPAVTTHAPLNSSAAPSAPSSIPPRGRREQTANRGNK